MDWQIAYLYGSKVYGTADEESDIDYVQVSNSFEGEKQVSGQNVDITKYSPELFQKMLDDHDVSALECFFLPPNLVGKCGPCPEFNFQLDLAKLRRSFSAKASNSWVKAKKKIDVHQEYRLGRKSLFHCLRILDFGIQIAEHGMIVDYSRANLMWTTIQEQGFETWQEYKDAWQSTYNNMRTEFRRLAPKE